jgi:RiboL-PSP-HEPN
MASVVKGSSLSAARLTMPSNSYRRWIKTQSAALDQMENAHASVGGTEPGRRYSTDQINHAYAILLASQFQGFCRDLHTESASHLVSALLPPSMRPIVSAEFTRDRKLDKGNANPGNLGNDFNRLGLVFWDKVKQLNTRNSARNRALELLNEWRNAIAHQDFDPVKLGGSTLRLEQVRSWRSACEQLARAFDRVMRDHICTVIGIVPWK